MFHHFDFMDYMYIFYSAYPLAASVPDKIIVNLLSVRCIHFSATCHFTHNEREAIMWCGDKHAITQLWDDEIYGSQSENCFHRDAVGNYQVGAAVKSAECYWPVSD